MLIRVETDTVSITNCQHTSSERFPSWFLYFYFPTEILILAELLKYLSWENLQKWFFPEIQLDQYWPLLIKLLGKKYSQQKQLPLLTEQRIWLLICARHQFDSHSTLYTFWYYSNTNMISHFAKNNIKITKNVPFKSRTTVQRIVIVWSIASSCFREAIVRGQRWRRTKKKSHKLRHKKEKCFFTQKYLHYMRQINWFFYLFRKTRNVGFSFVRNAAKWFPKRVTNLLTGRFLKNK